MIVLDTNVVAELMRDAPEPTVVEWLDSLPATEIATTAVTAAELRYGVARLPSGRRRTRLTGSVETMLAVDFAGRVEPFDADAASCYALLVVERERLGRPIGVADAQIAAICRARGHRLATRNTKDFTDTGVDLVDPWRGDR